MTRRLLLVGVVALLLLAACDGGGTTEDETEPAPVTEQSSDVGSSEAAPSEVASDDTGAPQEVATGPKVRIAFSAPAAQGGWLAAITANAREAASAHADVELLAPAGAADASAQIAQVTRLLEQAPDALVILPHDEALLTPVALQAMAQGVPVITVERPLRSPRAYRTFVGGDNYGVGVAAGNFFAQELSCKGKVVEIQGLAGIAVTDDRSRGFRDALRQCGRRIKIVASRPADFSPEKGLKVMEQVLRNQPDIDAVYTHDDLMAEGVYGAITNAGRDDEMFMTGVGGSAAALDAIAEGGLLRATFLYNPSMAASAVNLARLIALDEGVSELAEPDVPSTVVLPAATVTRDNVEDYQDLGY